MRLGIQNLIENLIEIINKKEANLPLRQSQYSGRNFGSKSKVSRKSHVKKDPVAVEELKKTSDKSVGISMKKTKISTKK